MIESASDVELKWPTTLTNSVKPIESQSKSNEISIITQHRASPYQAEEKTGRTREMQMAEQKVSHSPIFKP